MDLFRSAKPAYEPLASRMRPRNLDEFVGQEHILAPGRLLRRAIEADHLTSVIFYGPPGTGKTTLARLIAAKTQGAFLALNAVLTGVKEIREILEEARRERDLRGRKTLLFVDEVHRWNRSQQDALLPWVENGTFLLVGATTENPFFEVNAALVSRSRIFQLVPLDEQGLRTIVAQTLNDKERGYGQFKVTLEEKALEHLVRVSAGDARSLLNALELAVESAVSPFPPEVGTVIPVSLTMAEESLQKKIVLYDKDGDYHFDTISAFIKSLRGSDPDAALYWLAKMVAAGEDPQFLWRRMLISASEDIGLADPQAIVIVEAAYRAFEKVGLPEGQYALAQAALYLAVCPKSNSTSGYFEALKNVEAERAEVPTSLKDGSRDGKGFGHGQGYLYPHAFREHWVAQHYLPASLLGRVFYEPTESGWERNISAEVWRRRDLLLDLEVVDSENLTFTGASLNPWIQRSQSAPRRAEEILLAKVFDDLDLKRHDRLWIAEDRGFLLTREALARVPEGGVWVSRPPETQTQGAPVPRGAIVFEGGFRFADPNWLSSGIHFEAILFWAWPPKQLETLAKPFDTTFSSLIAEQGELVWLFALRDKGPRLLDFLKESLFTPEEWSKLRRLEAEFLALDAPPLPRGAAVITAAEQRILDEATWGRWWSSERQEGWGAFLKSRGITDGCLQKAVAGRPQQEVSWERSWGLLRVSASALLR